MKVALLIGFDYTRTNDNERKHLKGTIFDLYKIYKIIKAANYDKILIITDIENDINLTELLNIGITNNVVNFILKVKKENEYYLYESLKNFKDTVKNFLSNKEKVFVYFSGHYMKNKFFLPYNLTDDSIGNDSVGITYKNLNFSEEYNSKEKTNAKISLSNFTNLLSWNEECFIILDVCNGPGLDLPFKLEGTMLRHTSKDFINKKIVVMTSSTFFDKTLSTRSGSVFTDELTKLILSRIYNFVKIEERMKEIDQPVKITASYPNIQQIPSWVYFDNTLVIMYINGLLTLQKK